MHDELLVVRAQLGERDAFADLVRAWHDPVHTFARRMIGPRDADDVAQEVWLAVVRGLPRLREPARFAPWLFRIARRAVTNRLRAEYAQPAAETTAPEPDVGDLVADRATIAAGLAGVPVRERELLILFYLQDLSLESCAEICDVPVGTVKSRLARGRRLLRDALTRKGPQR
ncbi:RNA polymerase sigma factor [Catenuloplanes indicus]|uniref:RNA polymerase sigma-70 factor (ECF subfamily) n=1 Tax=Catenuloplanes indicus TaxID=137267 RepID=A0AAE3W6N1_9ACTN|nr:RNA polymerase sigma factor [Catenuloplanes indicus]MDQ0370295.1 RNA polymerase sigma-70 factor (ECF subfamily) [Catenuloplanes indicus]